MVFLGILLVLFALLHLPPQSKHLLLRKPRAKAAVAMGLGLAMTGIMHFSRKADFEALLPAWLPAHEAWVYGSGLFEVGCGLALVVEGTRRRAGLAAAAYFLLVLPVHVAVALGRATIPYMPAGRWFYWLRIPLQFVYIAWALWSTHPSPSPAAPHTPAGDVSR